MPIDLRKVGLSATSNLVSNSAGALKERFQATGSVENIGEKYKNVAKAKEGVYQFVDLRYPENIGTEKNKPALMFYIMSNENPELKKESGEITASGVRNIENEIPTTEEFAEQHQKSIQSNSDKIKENNDKNIPAKEKELDQKDNEILDQENIINNHKVDLDEIGEEKLNLENALKDYTQNLRIKEDYLAKREQERDTIRSRLDSAGYFDSSSEVKWEQNDVDDYMDLNGAVYDSDILVKKDTDDGEIGKLKKEIQEFNTKKVTVNEPGNQREIQQDKLDEERKTITDKYFAKEKEWIKSKNDLKKLKKEEEEIASEIGVLLDENEELAAKNHLLQVNEKQLKEENKKRNDAISEIKNLTKNQRSVPLTTKRNGNTKLASIISMYVPATVDSNLAAKYSEVDLSSFITAFGKNALGAAQATIGANIKVVNLKNMVRSATAATVDAFEKTLPGFREGAEIVRGTGIRTDRFELAFKGMEKRKFSFDFKFIPKSEEEAKQAYEIIKTFRYYMSPSITGDDKLSGELQKTGLKNKKGEDIKLKGSKKAISSLQSAGKIYFNQPAFFEIKFMMGNVRNQFPIDFGRCLLQSCNVKYGGDRTQFHKEIDLPDGSKGFPHGEIQMTLNFLEIETIYNKRVLEGY